MRLAWAVLPLAVFAEGCVNLDEPWRVAKKGSPDAADTAVGGTGGSPGWDGMARSNDTLGGSGGKLEADALGNDREVAPAWDSPAPADVPSDVVYVVTADAAREDTLSVKVDAASDAARDMMVADAFIPDVSDALADSAAVLPDVSDAKAADAVDACDAPAVDVPLTNTVTFASGFGQGLMTGEGWVSLGSVDSISSPTCGPQRTQITSATPCVGAKNWSSDSALCVSGSLPAMHTPPTQDDYTYNWGIQVGVNAKATTGAIGRSFSSITVTVTGAPLTGLRAEVHREEDAVEKVYCSELTSGVAMQLATFNTECWNHPGTGVAFPPGDSAKIDKVVVHVVAAASAITVTNLCLSRVVFQ